MHEMAGVCLLLGTLTSVFGQMMIPDRLVVSGSAAMTAANITSDLATALAPATVVSHFWIDRPR